MDHYHHLTIEQRENLLVCVNQGKKYAEIAAEIHCSESTVSREIRRNSASRQEYSAIKAQRAYEKRRKNSVRKPILADPKVVQTVSNLLEMAWSPEQISNRLKYEHNQLKISTSTIYRALDAGLLDEKLCKKLRIKGRLRHGGRKKSKCGHLDIEYSIHDRPKSADKRKTIGHWESDTVRGSKWTGCIATHVERKSHARANTRSCAKSPIGRLKYLRKPPYRHFKKFQKESVKASVLIMEKNFQITEKFRPN